MREPRVSSREQGKDYYYASCEFYIPRDSLEAVDSIVIGESAGFIFKDSIINDITTTRGMLNKSRPSKYSRFCNENPTPEPIDCIYPFEDPCDSIGLRSNGKYCSAEKNWIPQIADGETCENHFECASYTCISNECIDANFIQKILNWFRRLFS